MWGTQSCACITACSHTSCSYTAASSGLRDRHHQLLQRASAASASSRPRGSWVVRGAACRDVIRSNVPGADNSAYSSGIHSAGDRADLGGKMGVDGWVVAGGGTGAGSGVGGTGAVDSPLRAGSRCGAPAAAAAGRLTAAGPPPSWVCPRRRHSPLLWGPPSLSPCSSRPVATAASRTNTSTYTSASTSAVVTAAAAACASVTSFSAATAATAAMTGGSRSSSLREGCRRRRGATASPAAIPAAAAIQATATVTAAAASSPGPSQTASGPGGGSPPVPSPEQQQRLLGLLAEQLAGRGVELPPDLVPGLWHKGLCPFCDGGGGREPLSFNLIVSEDCSFAYYRCWRANKCGVEETVWAESLRKGLRRPQQPRPQLGEAERLELDKDALAYFAARGIRPETLRAAGVFQACNVPHPLERGALLDRVVAYPYYKDGQLVNVTYHDVHGYCLRTPLPGAPDGDEDDDDDSDADPQQRQLEPEGPQLPTRSSSTGATATATGARVHGPDPDPGQGGLSGSGPGPGSPAGPGLRWQLPGAERVLWGLDQLAFVGELRRHKQQLEEARKPPLARARARAQAGGSGAAATASAAAAAAGAASGVAAGAGAAGAAAASAAALQRVAVAAVVSGGRDGSYGIPEAAGSLAAVSKAQDGAGYGTNYSGGKLGVEGAEAAYDKNPFEGEEAEENEEVAEASEGDDESDYDEYDEMDEQAEDGVDEGQDDEDENEDVGDEYEDPDGEYDDDDDGYDDGYDGIAGGDDALQPLGVAAGGAAAFASEVDAFSDLGPPSAPLGPSLPESRLDVVLVEDEVERLCMMEAGIPNVLALPPRAVLDYHRHCEVERRTRAEARTGAGAAAGSRAGAAAEPRRGRPPEAAAAAAPAAGEVMSYVFNSRSFLCPEPAVVGGQVRVTLALKESPDSRMLAEELATGLARERCRVLRWPSETSDLPPCSLARQRAEAASWSSYGNPYDDEAEYDPGPDYLREDFAEEVAQQTWYGTPPSYMSGAIAAAPPPLPPRSATGGGLGGGAAAGAPAAVLAPAGAVTSGAMQLAQLTERQQRQQQQQQSGRTLRGCAVEVLLEDGREALRYLVGAARPYPVRGLVDVTGLWDELLQHWYGKEQTAAGVSTGWPGLDELYRVTPGELTVVTGVPNSGKSHWLDALAVQLASRSGWRIAFASFEKSVVRHAQNLIELSAHKSMFSPQGLPLLTPDEFHENLAWVNDHFVLIRHSDMADEPAPEEAEAARAARAARARPPGRGGAGDPEGDAGAAPGQQQEGDADADADADLTAQALEEARQPCTIDWVLAKATQAVYRYGIRGLVIDPYNELEQRRGAQTETEYVSAMLGKVKRWAQRYLVHVWLVAHPKSMEEWDGSPPTMYDISGSAHWYNKADMGLVVHRYTRVAIDAALRKQQSAGRSRKPPQIPWSDNETLIKVLKARNKTSGMQGDYTLVYDKQQCRFRDPRVDEVRHC